MTVDAPDTPPPPTAELEVPLPADWESPRVARSRAREVLAAWKLDRLVDPVVLVVSELVTNAVRYGRPPLQMVLRREADHVELGVRDANPAPPRQASADEDAESGRGLSLVEAAADGVALEEVPDDGKVVRARFDTTG